MAEWSNATVLKTTETNEAMLNAIRYLVFLVPRKLRILIPRISYHFVPLPMTCGHFVDTKGVRIDDGEARAPFTPES